MDKLLTVREVAGVLNCHPHSVYRLVESNEIPHVRRQGIGHAIGGDTDPPGGGTLRTA